MTDPAEKRIRTQAKLLSDLLEAIESAVVQERTPLDRHLRGVFRARREFGSRDRRLFRDVAFAYVRWRGWLEPAQLSWPQAAAAAWLLDATELHPAIRHLLSPGEAASAVPLGDADLPTRQAWLKQFLSLDAEPAPEALVPAWWRASLPDACRPGADALLAAQQDRLPLWLRLRGDPPEAFTHLLEQIAGEVIGCPPIPDAIGLPPGTALAPLEQVAANAFDVQDLSSQAVVKLCQPAEGESWWDACAGSGGKSMALADALGPQGRVLATDSRRPMLRELRRRAQRAQIHTLHPLRRDLRRETAPGNDFHGILVDAPCTGTGTWARHPDARWRTQADDIQRQATRQRELLERIAPSVAPGGVLVYAVCSLTRRETDDVVDLFLARHDEFTLDPVPHPLFETPTDGRIWMIPPESPGNGMFAARFRRRKTL